MQKKKCNKMQILEFNYYFARKKLVRYYIIVEPMHHRHRAQTAAIIGVKLNSRTKHGPNLKFRRVVYAFINRLTEVFDQQASISIATINVTCIFFVENNH